MKKKLLIVVLVFAFCIGSASAAFTDEPEVIPSIIISIPGVPGMTATFTNVCNYYYEGSVPEQAAGHPDQMHAGDRLYIFLFTVEGYRKPLEVLPDGTIIPPSPPYERSDAIFSVDVHAWGVGFGASQPSEEEIMEYEEGKILIGGESALDGDAECIIMCSMENGEPLWIILAQVQDLGFDDSLTNSGTISLISELAVVSPPLPDQPSTWAQAEVSAAIAAGLAPPELQKNYTKPVTRGEVAQMFINLIEKASGQPIDAFMAAKGVSINTGAFTDTTDKAVLAANALGIINGIGENRFDPGGILSRAQIAAIINRTARVMGADTDGYTHAFTDTAGHWVDAELGWPVHTGIIRGESDTRFNPNGNLTTEQAIAITYRALTPLSQ